MNPAKKLKYNYTWALGIVIQLHERHARATDIVLEVFDISLKQLALFLAYGDPMFPYLRERVHQVEKLAERLGKYYTLVEYVSWFSDLAKNKYSGQLADRLDKRLKLIKLKEQGSRGEGDGAMSLPPSPQSIVEEGRVQYLLNL